MRLKFRILTGGALFVAAMALSAVDLFLFERLQGWERALTGRSLGGAAASLLALALYVTGMILILNALRDYAYPGETSTTVPVGDAGAASKWHRPFFVPPREAGANLQAFSGLVWLIGCGGLLISLSILWTLVRALGWA